MRSRRSYEQLVLEYWQPLLEFAVGATGLLVFLCFHLRSSLPGLATTETSSVMASRTVHALLTNPLYLPHKLLQYIITKLGHYGIFASRLPSVFFGLAFVVLFFLLIKRWFDTTVAALSTVLLATSSWFLFTTRIATPDVLYLGLVGVFAIAAWLHTSKQKVVGIGAVGLMIGSLLYTPGFIWFLVAGLLWQRKRLWQLTKDYRGAVWLAIVCLTVGLVPLLLGLSRKPALLKTYIGLPDNFSVSAMPHNFLGIFKQLLVHGSSNAVTSLPGVAYLDILTIVMVVLGTYWFVQNRSLDKCKVVLGATVLSLVLVSLGGPVSISLLLPLIYVLAAAGMTYMLRQWQRVFPRNPFAHGLILTLLCLAVFGSVYYQTKQYFTAWPNTPEVRTSFDQRPSLK